MDPRDLRVTQTTFFTLLAYAKQLSLVTLCDMTAGRSVTYGRTYGRTDRREVKNSYLDVKTNKTFREINL